MGTEHNSIMEVKRFMDNHGREVQEFNQVFGKNKEEPFYRGRAMIRVQPMGPNGPMPSQTVPFEFMFPEGISLKRAFEVFDETAKKEVDEHAKKMKEQAELARMEEAKKQADANRVIPARTMPKIVGANGKPL